MRNGLAIALVIFFAAIAIATCARLFMQNSEGRTALNRAVDAHPPSAEPRRQVIGRKQPRIVPDSITAATGAIDAADAVPQVRRYMFRVVDEAGVPLSGVEVEFLKREVPKTIEDVIARGKTDGDGILVFETQDDAFFAVFNNGLDPALSGRTIAVDRRADASQRFSIVLSRKNASLRIRVARPSGTPVVNAIVSVKNVRTGATIRRKTGELGDIYIDRIEAAELEVQALVGRGTQPVMSNSTVTRIVTENCSESFASIIAGDPGVVRVVADIVGAGAPFSRLATATIIPHSAAFEPIKRTFAIPGSVDIDCPEDTVTVALDVDDDPLMTFVTPSTICVPASGVVECRARVYRSGLRLAGAVIDEHNQRLAGVTVFLRSLDPLNPTKFFHITTKTNELGEFVFSDVLPGVSHVWPLVPRPEDSSEISPYRFYGSAEAPYLPVVAPSDDVILKIEGGYAIRVVVPERFEGMSISIKPHRLPLAFSEEVSSGVHVFDKLRPTRYTLLLKSEDGLAIGSRVIDLDRLPDGHTVVTIVMHAPEFHR